MAVAFVAAVIGCGGDDEGRLRLRFDVEYVGGGRATCADAGTPVVEVSARRIPGGEPITWRLPCAGGSGDSPPLAEGGYEVLTRLLDGAGRGVSGLVLPVDAVVDCGETTEIGRVIFEILAFSFGFVLEAGQGEAAVPVGCAQAGAATVELETTAIDDPGRTATYTFPCAARAGRTTAVPAGRYAITFRLLSASGAVLSATDTALVELDGRTPADLGDVVFEVP
jgi:hypothetical protein